MKKTLALLIVLVVASITTSPAFAGVEGGAFTVSPFIGGYTFDGTQHANTNVTTGLRLGYNLTGNWGVETEFLWARLLPKVNIPGYYNLFSGRGELLYHFMPESRLVPFVALGGGYSRTEGASANNNDAILDYGGGVKFFLNDWLALRGDVRHIFSFHPSDASGGDNYWQNLEYTAGLTFQFGAPRPATPAVKAEAPVEEAKAPLPTPVEEVKAPVPAPAAVVPPAHGPDEVILPGRLPSPAAPSAAPPAPESAPVPAPAWGGPTSWQAAKTDAPKGKIMVTGFRVVDHSLEISATGRFFYQVYTLAQPSRLVIDVTDGLNGFRDNRIAVNRIGISDIRLEDNPDYLRIVLDSAQQNLLPYRIEETGNGLKVIVTKPAP